MKGHHLISITCGLLRHDFVETNVFAIMTIYTLYRRKAKTWLNAVLIFFGKNLIASESCVC
jgi:hypothetical protein